MTAMVVANDLRQRGAVEDGVERHRLAMWNKRTVAIGLAVDNVPIVADDEHGGGDLLSGDRVIDDGVDH